MKMKKTIKAFPAGEHKQRGFLLQGALIGLFLLGAAAVALSAMASAGQAVQKVANDQAIASRLAAVAQRLAVDSFYTGKTGFAGDVLYNGATVIGQYPVPAGVTPTTGATSIPVRATGWSFNSLDSLKIPGAPAAYSSQKVVTLVVNASVCKRTELANSYVTAITVTGSAAAGYAYSFTSSLTIGLTQFCYVKSGETAGVLFVVMQ